jgi:DNA polymerase I-like protein with 3'-5' exonuclease and polymerase domains
MSAIHNAQVARAEECLRRLAVAKEVCVDVETSGLDWRKNHVVGHVLTFGPRPNDTYYLPFRHAGGGNIEGTFVPKTSDGWKGGIHPIEVEIVELLDRPGLRIFGHNLGFDLKFYWRLGLTKLDADFECTQTNAALIDELQGGFGLDFCARLAGVQAKKTTIYEYIASKFPEVNETPKSAMGHYWRLAGDDVQAVDYAMGDGTTTWQLRDWQHVRIKRVDMWRDKPVETLERVHRVECKLIPILTRMSCVGIKIDEERLHWLDQEVHRRIVEARKALPKDFNSRSPKQVKELMEQGGYTNWPKTPPSKTFPRGQPSFPESFLISNPIGQQIIKIRKYTNLLSSFIEPMMGEHLWKGRVHTNYNQLRGDEYGTITGRLSSDHPNLQQCLAKGTRVTIPGGYKNIEDVKPGDLVYSFDKNKRLVLRKVTWAGQTGLRELVRLHWKGSGGRDEKGKVPRGYLDLTPDHPVRLITGEYCRADKLQEKSGVLALRRNIANTTSGPRNRLSATGYRIERETKFVFQQVYGWQPETVHHKDDNSLNDNPNNLEAMTNSQHSKHHMSQVPSYEKRRRVLFTDPKIRRKVCDAGGEAAKQLIFKTEITEEKAREAYKKTNSYKEAGKLLGCGASTIRRRLGLEVRNNHRVIRVEKLEGVHPVYDITVHETENFIANEICVHNCPKHNYELGKLFRSIFIPDTGKIWGAPDYSQIEPRLVAIYTHSRVLCEGYLANPPVDAHYAVSAAANSKWSVMTKEARKAYRDNIGKRINQTIITGGGQGVLVSKYGIPADEVKRVWDDYFRVMPELAEFQAKVTKTYKMRGYMVSLLGRRSRLEASGYAYKALNRLLQGGNADILKSKLVEVDEYLKSEGRPIDLLNNCHDAVDYQFDESNRRHYSKCLEIMVDFSANNPWIGELFIPITVDAHEGKNWAVATYGED